MIPTKPSVNATRYMTMCDRGGFSLVPGVDRKTRGWIWDNETRRETLTFFSPYSSRYIVEAKICKPSDGWVQYDTDQDAWYFGVWVNLGLQAVACYAEGDLTFTFDALNAGFKEQLKSMNDFYGEAPPAWMSIDEDGTVTLGYSGRPA
jgi:hypothetical protein